MSRRNFQRSFEVLFAEYTVGILGSDELPEIALCSVREGIDSTSLGALAGSGAHEHPADLRDMFERGLNEAGIAPLSDDRAALIVIEQNVRDVGERRATASDVLLHLKRMFDLLAGVSPGAATVGPSRLSDLVPLREAVNNLYYCEDGDYEAPASALQEACERRFEMISPPLATRTPYR